jgi:hypothetical protein
MVLRVRPASETGFVLPLSITGALVLLLSSLSMQSLVLHTRQVQAAERTRLRAEDQLASAAQRLAADLQGRFACLQAVPLTDGHSGALPATCPAELDSHALQQLSMDGQAIELLGWTPQPTGGVAALQLAGGGLQRRYALTASGVKELG